MRGRLEWRALRRAPDVDLLLALAAFAALLVDPLLLHKITELTPVMGVLAFLTAVPLAARRRFPLGVLAIELPLLLACLAVFHPNRAAVGITMLLVFTVGLEGGRSRSLVVGALMAPIVTAAVFITGTRVGPVDIIAYSSLVLGALLAGETLRARQELGRALAEDAARKREAAAQHRFDGSASRWPTKSTTSSGMRWWPSTSRLRPLRAASVRPARARPRPWMR